MNDIFVFVISAAATFVGMLVVWPTFLAMLRVLGCYAIVEEGTCHVYVLFGKIVAGNARITLVPPKSDLLTHLLAARGPSEAVLPPPVR